MPAAAYKLTRKVADERGVYSFCMCPGGYVVNASSEEGKVAVNGMSYSAKNGAISYLPNPYIENNLALTMQMKLASDSLVPGFARKIYLKSLRFNLHLHPGAMLIEAGAQTNTVEEMRSAMEVLARVLGDVLY